MQILLSGSTGQLGRRLLEYIDLQGWSVDTIGRQSHCTYQCDFSHFEESFKCTKNITKSYDYIIHTAALTDVDECESNVMLAHNINAGSTLLLSNLSNRVGSKLVFISTDYVFDGRDGPYDEDRLCNPINVYGLTKRTAELYISMVLSESWSLIVRTCVLYDKPESSKSFIQWLYSQKDKNEVKIIDDQFVTPTFTPDLAQWIIQAIKSGTSGTRHVVGSQLLNRFDIAQICFKIWSSNTQLIPYSSSFLEWKAKRPLRSGLITKYENPHFRILREVVN